MRLPFVSNESNTGTKLVLKTTSAHCYLKVTFVQKKQCYERRGYPTNSELRYQVDCILRTSGMTEIPIYRDWLVM